MGDFWDNHDLADYWDQIEPVEMTFKIEERFHYYALDTHLSQKFRECAKNRGVSAQTLLNLWVQEKLLTEEGDPEKRVKIN